MNKHIEILKKTDCMGCTACENICPKKCIEMKRDSEGYLYPQVDTCKCIECGACKRICPMLNEGINKNELKDVKVLACVSKNDTVLMESSSGGVFSHLAYYIIENGGIVFGAMYDEKFNVIHSYIDKKENIGKMRGSKYVQSDLKNTFSQAKEFLLKDKYVLFSGTPCQIAGLKKYLGKDYNKLFTCDFICTGVPSPKLYQAYIEYYRNEFSSEINDIQFRSKIKGWDNFSMLISTSRKKYIGSRYVDPYIQAQYSHISLRPACYECKFKECQSGSDIKLGDYWFVKNIHSQIYDYNGVSLVILESEKGKRLFDSVSNGFKVVPSHIENVIRTNASFSVSPKIPQKREKYLNVIQNTCDYREIVKCIKSLTKISQKRKCIIWLRNVKSKLIYRNKH